MPSPFVVRHQCGRPNDRISGDGFRLSGNERSGDRAAASLVGLALGVGLILRATLDPSLVVIQTW